MPKPKYPREVKRCIDEIAELISSNYDYLKDDYPDILSRIKWDVKCEIGSYKQRVDERIEDDRIFGQHKKDMDSIRRSTRNIKRFLKELEDQRRSRVSEMLGFERPLKPSWTENDNGVVELYFPRQ
jgi:hypothetical protein